MLVYVDSSALLKRVVAESESIAIGAALGAAARTGTVLASSTLAWVEVTRALRSRLDTVDPRLIGRLSDSALSGVQEAQITPEVTAVARRIGPPTLRSLDAIHLATATLLEADEVWAYDRRLLDAADGLGLVTASPV
ncbi:type II toxin-antitoxin system VapC family toxin [Agromyces bauzanensis]|uniref:Ribonuclease VapC n=1 Tax=Agromyces bauzanensis TaxID=1308924 RepID=A0A917PES0_9MICO|nr:type II toxin-antitoxin system VapC family toxin [Agromyces bauzanensis]GGJ73010.1 ribonuclease VapC [Agromyces bauzanensis]